MPDNVPGVVLEGPSGFARYTLWRPMPACSGRLVTDKRRFVKTYRGSEWSRAALAD